MIQKFVNKFMVGKPHLRELFAQKHPENYESIVKNVAEIILPAKYTKVYTIDLNNNYQGTLLFVIQCNIGGEQFWAVRVDYGSCSGCDTLESIRNYSKIVPNKTQINDYITLALQIVQQLKEI